MENLFNEAKTLYDNTEHDILLDYIAAMIIKAQNTLYQLFDMINKVAVFRGSSKNLCYTFINPFNYIYSNLYMHSNLHIYIHHSKFS
jgi:hypothetical protein